MFKYRKLCLVRDNEFYGIVGMPTGILAEDGEELCVGDCVEYGDWHDILRGLITEVNGYYKIDGRHSIPCDARIIKHYMDLKPGDKVQYAYGVFKVKKYKENKDGSNGE